MSDPGDQVVEPSELRLIRTLRAIVGRAPTPSEVLQGRLAEILAGAQAAVVAESPPDEFRQGWRSLVEEILLSPADLAAFFPRLCEEHRELTEAIRRLSWPTTDEATKRGVGEARQSWLAEQATLDEPTALIPTLLRELRTADFLAGGEAFLGRYYRFTDALHRHLVEPAWRPLHRRILELLDLRRANWVGGDVGGYAYQGYDRIGISGVKPTEVRLAGYELDEFLVPDARVLDIGSNCGFVSLEIARSVRQVEAIEYDPYLVLVGRAVADALGVDNVDFVCADFTDHPIPGGFDVVLSLAHHESTDQHMTMPWADYVAKLFSLLRPGGILLFESHIAVNGGWGEPGDDGDLKAKFDVAKGSFEVVRYKMTRALVPVGGDVDEFLVVLRRREQVDESAIRTLDLYAAPDSHEYRRL